jgi:LacI family transcriptional regulator
MMTLGLLRAISETKVLCPDEISVIGFDEPAPDAYGFSLSTLLKPELTVVAQPGYEMGQRAAQMLLTMLSNNEPEDDGKNKLFTFQAELRIRKSAAARAQ